MQFQEWRHLGKLTLSASELQQTLDKGRSGRDRVCIRERLQCSQGEGLGTSLYIASAPPNAATNRALYGVDGLGDREKTLVPESRGLTMSPNFLVALSFLSQNRFCPKSCLLE
jgi:hypothetical protein